MMGWGTEFKGYISRTRPEEFDDVLDDNEDSIHRAICHLIALASQDGKDKFTDEGYSIPWHQYVAETVLELTTEIQGYAARSALIENAKAYSEPDELEVT